MSIILPRTCCSPFQSQEYGPSLRLHNICERGAGKARCTVCGKEKALGAKSIERKADNSQH